MTALDPLRDLRLGDLHTFLAVRRHGSITAAARGLHVTPSQVSKAIARLEGQLGVALLARGSRGVSVSASGQRLVPHIEEVVRRASLLRTTEAIPELSVAGSSFLIALLLPAISVSRPDLRVRGLELPPTLVRASAAENLFDMALTTGLDSFSDGWLTSRIGEVEKKVFASPALAARLGPGPVSEDRLRDVPFITPVYYHGGQLVVADDGCPMGAERVVGHQVQTFAVALELAVHTPQLAFGPAFAARALCARGALVELPVREWCVRDPVYVACNETRMLARLQRDIVGVLREELRRLG